MNLRLSFFFSVLLFFVDLKVLAKRPFSFVNPGSDISNGLKNKFGEVKSKRLLGMLKEAEIKAKLMKKVKKRRPGSRLDI